MESSRRRTQVQNHFGILIFAFIFVNTLSAFAGPGKTTYQAKIVKPDGYPLEASSVNFKFTILDPAGSCILYSETYSSVNMSSTGGLISFALGSGVKTYPASATTFEQVFSNITPSLSCDAGGPTDYSPTATDIRKIVMQFHDGSGWQTLPAMSINAVPYAMYANEATKLNGLAASDLVQLSTVPTCAASEALRYTGAGFTCIAVGNSVTSGTVVTALGYTPADGVSVTALSSSLATTDSNVSSVSSTVFSVSSTVTSLQNSVAASFAAITSSQWTTSGTNIFYNTGNVGIGTTTPVTTLDVSGGVRIGAESTTCAPALAGTLRYNASNVEYCNGTSWQAFGVSGAGLQSLNGSTSGTQSFATGTGGTAPNITTANGVHTLNIPLASTGSVTAGLISNADYTTFTNKITSSAASIAQVLGYVPADNAVSGTYAQKANNLSDLTNVATARTNLGLGTFATASSIDLGSASATGTLAIARLPSFSGDATIAAASNTIILSNSGVTAGTYTKVTVDSKGRVTSSSALVSSDVTTALGYTPANSATIVSSQWATSGTTINYMNGNVGIGTNTPTQKLEVVGNIATTTMLYSETGLYDLGFNNTGFAFPANGEISLQTNGLSRLHVLANGNIGVGIANPSAKLELTSGTATVAPLKFTSGTLLSSAQSGSFEYDGFNFYVTDSTNTRRTIATGSSDGTIDNASNINSSGNITMTPVGSVVVSSTTASTNSSTGALVVKGGLGVASNINIAGNLNVSGSSVIDGSLKLSSMTSGSVLFAGANGTVSQDNPNFYWDGANKRLGIGTSTFGPNGLLQVNGDIGLAGTRTIRPASNSDADSLRFLGTQVVAGQLNSAAYNYTDGGLLAARAAGDSTLLLDVGRNIGSATLRIQNTIANEISAELKNSSGTSVFYASTNSGNVGIGTNSPTSPLDVTVTDTSSGIILTNTNSTTNKYPIIGAVNYAGSTTGHPVLSMSNALGTSAAPVALNSGMNLGTLLWSGRITASQTMQGARIDAIAEANFGVNTAPTRLTFSVAPPSGDYVQRMVINSMGNVGIGITTPAAKLHLAAGTSSTAGLKFTSGTLLTSPESGTMEYDGFNFYVTDSTNTRRTIATGSSSGTIDNASNINSSGNITLTPVGSVIVSSTTASTNSSTGALIVKGGLGVAGDIYTSGTIVTSSNIQGVSVTATSGMISPYIYGSTASGGVLTLDSTTHSTKGSILLAPNGGNIGIGTSSPQQKLHLGGAGIFRIQDNDDTSPHGYLEFGVTTAGSWSRKGYIGMPGAGSAELAIAADGAGTPIYLKNTTGTVMTVSGSNVGIGTTNPAAKLDVAGQAWFGVTNKLKLQESGDALSLQGTLATDDNQKKSLWLNAWGGSVGVGTTTPEDTTGMAGQAPKFAVSGGYTNLNLLRINGSDTGNTIYSAQSALTLSTGGGTNQHIILNPNGNVGIGSTAPAEKLDVSGNIKARIQQTGNSTGVLIGNAASERPVVSFHVSDNSTRAKIEVNDVNGANERLGFFTGSEVLSVMANGRVGIGTTTPGEKLHVSSGNILLDNAQYIKQKDDTGTVRAVLGTLSDGTVTLNGYHQNSVITAVNGATYFSGGSSTNMTILTGGNVGIGTNAPGTLLDVNGVARAATYTFPAPVGDPAPTITARTVPAGQGSAAEKTELILFHSNDPANGSGNDQITLRAPALSFQTYNDAAVADINNNNGYNERMYITPTGNVGIGTTNPGSKLEVGGGALFGGQTVSGANVGFIHISSGQLASDSFTRYGYWNGVINTGIYDVGYIGSTGAFTIRNVSSGSENPVTSVYLASSGNFGIGTSAPSAKLDVVGTVNSSSHISQGTQQAYPLVSWGAATSSSGAIIIKLPGGYSNYGMINVEIDTYEYNTNGATKYYIGGHNWNGAWYNYTNQTIGNSNKKVRLGYKDGQYAIVIGDNTSSWSYGSVKLTKITNGDYYTSTMNLKGTYTITQDASAEVYDWISADLNKSYFGHTSVSGNLSVTGDGYALFGPNSGWGATLRVGGNGGTATAHASIATTNGNMHIDALDNSHNSYINWYRGADFYVGNGDGGTGLFTVKNSGNVGVGTILPGAKLDVVGDTRVSTGSKFTWPNDGGGGGGDLAYIRYHFDEGGENGSLDFVTRNDADDDMKFIGGYFSFMPNEIGNGNVGIGTASPSEKLHVVGNLRVQGSTDCTLGNGAGGTNCSSDVRLKENIKPIPYALKKIVSLKGVEFDWNEKSISHGRHDIGVIAQDVEKVFPSAVIDDKNTGYKKVDYAVLVAPLIQAVKELYILIMGEKDHNTQQGRQIAQTEEAVRKLAHENQELKVENAKLKAKDESKTQQLNDIRAYLCAKDPNAPICK